MSFVDRFATCSSHLLDRHKILDDAFRVSMERCIVIEGASDLGDSHFCEQSLTLHEQHQLHAFMQWLDRDAGRGHDYAA